MASFTTRVELTDADWDDYENLHKAMAAKGFSKTIEGTNGVEYDLPDAEYSLVADLTRSQVVERAKEAVAVTRKVGRVLVTEGPRSWSNLARTE